MKKRMMNSKKGFTLIEVIIAIAVFAVLSSMVLMIISQAIKTQKAADDNEDSLNTLMRNVINEQAQKRYSELDSNTLSMKFDKNGTEKDYSVTYTVVDGYKNYIECPSCHAKHGNLEYMEQAVFDYFSGEIAKLPANSNAQIEKTNEILDKLTQHSLSYFFLFYNGDNVDGRTGTDDMICPDCGTKLDCSKITLFCKGCEAECALSDVRAKTTGAFKFDKEKGSYICSKCQGGNISQKLTLADGSEMIISETVDEDAAFNLTGITANAIRYSNIKEPTVEDKKDLVSIKLTADDTPALEDSENKVSVWLTTSNNDPSKPIKYKMQIKTNFKKVGDNYHRGTLNIELPGCYIFKVTKVSDSLKGDSDTVAKLETPADPNYASGNPTVLTITNANARQNDYWFEFTLQNYENGNSFDYDYETEGGLALFWFGIEHAYQPMGTWTTNEFIYDIKSKNTDGGYKRVTSDAFKKNVTGKESSDKKEGE